MHGANAYAAACAAPPGDDELLAGTRKFLAHEAHKEPVLRAKARAAGFTLRGAPQMRDPTHLELRLASLRLDARADIRTPWTIACCSRCAALPPADGLACPCHAAPSWPYGSS